MSLFSDAIEGAGDVLTAPGRYLRGALAGRPGESMSGSQLLNALGGVDEGSDLGMYGGLAADLALDPMMWLSGLGAGAVAGGRLAKLGRGAKAAEEATGAAVATRPAQAAMPELAEFAGVKAPPGPAWSRVDPAVAAERTRLEQAVAAEPVMSPGLAEAGTQPLPGGSALLGRLRQTSMELPPDDVFLSPRMQGVGEALAGMPDSLRTYSSAAGQPDLGLKLLGAGVGRPAGAGKVRLPQPAGAMPDDVAALRGNRLFGGPALDDAAVMPQFAEAGAMLNPQRTAAERALQAFLQATGG